MAEIPADLAAGLPPDLELLVAGIEGDPGTHEERAGAISYTLAEHAGTLRPCDVCGRPVLEAGVLAETLLQHYGHTADTESRLEDAIRGSHLETGDPLSPNYCSYHAEITSE